MTVSGAFLIVVDDVISLYSPAFPYACMGIEELLQTCIYRLSRLVIELLNLLGGIIECPEPQDGQWSTPSKFGFCCNFAHKENVFHHSFTLTKFSTRVQLCDPGLPD